MFAFITFILIKYNKSQSFISIVYSEFILEWFLKVHVTLEKGV